MHCACGIQDVYIVEGNVNSDFFLNFIQQCLLPILLPFDGGDNPCSVVIFDNASIHHIGTVTQLISATGALVQLLPPDPPILKGLNRGSIH